ncbi:acyl-CoA synthetase [Hymenobacter chitinivorans]|uniref:Fatty-acyl-CoA synthase n=1 Tax=Hymenobacter chitinivorans DSM 11115 TaxID=1121954 RepID=A0A2M9BST7_9BACT|nr:acyl-CoA synthetase [Hymenobacter chitinivorans]PJJ61018.1 fatty-acyl-CoA synthase [Hymenobacter chitinivorans DSM 11115]
MPGYQSLADLAAIEQTPLRERPSAPNTFAMVEQGAALNPGALALRFVLNGEQPTRSTDFTYAQVLDRLHQTANLLHELGVGATDVVSYLLPNLPETAFTFIGAQAAGIVNPINPLLEPAQIADILNACGTKVLVTLRAFPKTDIWQKVEALAALVPTLETVLTVDLRPYLPLPQRLAVGALRLAQATPQLPGRRVLDFGRELRRQPADRLTSGRTIASTDAACYFHTGGTTGTPKIAPLTHRNLTFITGLTEFMTGTAAETGPLVYFCGLPMFHINGAVVTICAPWSMGHTLVLGSPAGYRGPGIVANFWELVEHYRITLFSGVPTVFSRLLEVPTTGRDLSSLQYAICGAAPLSRELILEFERRTGLRIAEGYGSTECSCINTLTPFGGDGPAGSIGLRLPYQDVRIGVLDAQTGLYQRPAEPNESGTILIRGENVFRGYLQAGHNQGVFVDVGDGQAPFFNTGDLGRQDAHGYFYITGRQKELIIRGGHNIDPRLIEDALQQHPGVALAAAIGSPDPDAGELPVAYVTRVPGHAVTEAELLTFAAAHISERAAVPKRIYLADELPLTAIGKIFKPALLKQEIARVFTQRLTQAGLQVQPILVRDDKQLGLVAEIDATGPTGTDVAPAVQQALKGYTVPYVLRPAAG